jgi:hypothetical protein
MAVRSGAPRHFNRTNFIKTLLAFNRILSETGYSAAWSEAFTASIQENQLMDRRAFIVSIESVLSGAPAGTPAPVDARRLINHADVIYAVEAESKQDILLFGKAKLERIARSDVPEGARVLRIAMGSDRRKLQRLLTLVRETKGSHDYAETA